MSSVRGQKPISTQGYLEYVGPIHWDGETVMFTVEIQHLNVGRMLHGGMLMTLAEVACRQSALVTLEENEQLDPISINCDFVAGASEGAQLVGRGTVTRRSRTVVFVTADLMEKDRILMTATSLYRIKTQMEN